MTNSKSNNVEGVFEPIVSLQGTNILSPKALVTSHQGQIIIELMNLSEEVLHLSKNIILGIFRTISEEEEIVPLASHATNTSPGLSRITIDRLEMEQEEDNPNVDDDKSSITDLWSKLPESDRKFLHAFSISNEGLNRNVSKYKVYCCSTNLVLYVKNFLRLGKHI